MAEDSHPTERRGSVVVPLLYWFLGLVGVAIGMLVWTRFVDEQGAIFGALGGLSLGHGIAYILCERFALKQTGK